ncbi:MAG: hypothetical protein A4E73_00960 [Syntrophaceae bacterium PtaU1.Bin231]|nr:MAG: hypothetical protein A4E73_00960 [Syntrophaceae bacterium PtaU1.Bin231]
MVLTPAAAVSGSTDVPFFQTDGVNRQASLVTTRDAATGGADVIDGGDGNNIILGGIAGDSITTGTGTDLILGDNGSIQYDAAGMLSRLQATNPELGAIDTINAGAGTKHIIGGFGADSITAGAGDHVVIGDNGRIDYDSDGAVKVLQTTDTADHPEYGGNDTITVGDGNNHILAGMGGDTVREGTGTGIVIGDNGSVTYAGVTGSLKIKEIISTLPENGGDDQLLSGDGNKYVIGGMGSDRITTGSGADVLLGDNGTILFTSTGILDILFSTSAAIGADDVITAGEGSNILIGGTGADRMFAGSAKDILIGDGGQVTLVDGEWRYVETIDLHIGGDDWLDGGPGEDVMFGCTGKNTFVGTLADDTMVGTYGRVTIQKGNVQTVVRLDSIDIVTNTMTELESGRNGASGQMNAGVQTGTGQGSGGVGGMGYTGFAGGTGGYESTGTGGVAGLGLMERGTPLVLASDSSRHGQYTTGPGAGGQAAAGGAAGGAAGPGSGQTTAEGSGGSGEPAGPQPGTDAAGDGAAAGGAAAGGAQQGGQQPGSTPGAGQGGAQQPGQEGSGPQGTEKQNDAMLDAAAETAITGLMGWKVISGSGPREGGVVDTQSFQRLAQKQENRRYKRWKNAGSWK